MQKYVQRHAQEIVLFSVAVVAICLATVWNQRKAGSAILLGLQLCLLVSTFTAERWNAAAWRLAAAFAVATVAIFINHAI